MSKSSRFAVLVLLCLIDVDCKRHTSPIPAPAQPAAPSIEEQWKAGAALVEEDRKEAIGASASVNVPQELRQYADRRMFLATQTADSLRSDFQPPVDYYDLASLASDGKVVELPVISHDYILFGVGEIATVDMLTYFDRERSYSVPLFPSYDAYKTWLLSMQNDAAAHQESIRSLRLQLSRLPAQARSERRSLQAAAAKESQAIEEANSAIQSTQYYYGDPVVSSDLIDRYNAFAKLAQDFGGQKYDLTEGQSRLAFKQRLLSFARPVARDVITELATAYSKQFNRPLPVTSLIRTEEYQRQLASKNPNAARNQVPPHTTGLAFDVYYHYMSAREQEFLMDMIAKLKDAGRIEALRESRDHFHIYVFEGGTAPPAELVARTLHPSDQNRQEQPTRGRTRASSATVALNHRPASSQQPDEQGKNR